MFAVMSFVMVGMCCGLRVVYHLGDDAVDCDVEFDPHLNS